MNRKQNSPLPSPLQLLEELPRKNSQKCFIEKSRLQIGNILHRRDPRFLIVVGPCSIHDLPSAHEYASRLKQLSSEVDDLFLLVMRTYVEKARSTIGWKGFLYDPDLNGSYDIAKGVRLSRQLFLDLAEMELPVATEFLDPCSAAYLSDLTSWGSIGARTSSSQIHRQLASQLEMPIGFKNNTDGNFYNAIDGVITARKSHAFIATDEKGSLAQITSSGNPYGHIVLRGGRGITNYDEGSVAYARERLKRAKLPPHLLVDCSHDNSSKDPEQQEHVFRSVIRQTIDGDNTIVGTMLESHLAGGNQSISALPSLRYGLSITDPCMDWETTESLILWAYEQKQTLWKKKSLQSVVV